MKSIVVRYSILIKVSYWAIYIQWCLPGLGSRVAITLSPSPGADLVDCQSQYIRETKEWETKNETIILRTQSYEPISPTTDWYAQWRPFSEFGAQGNSIFIGRW